MSTEQDTEKSREVRPRRSLLVVNMRGMVNTRRSVRRTLEQLKLMKRFNATILPDNEVYRGMLTSAKEHLSWCQLDMKTAVDILSKRAETSDGRRAKESNLRESGYSNFSDLASALAKGEASLKNELGIRQFFRLSPPRGGFKRSIRRQFGEGGILGANEELPKLVERMV